MKLIFLEFVDEAKAFLDHIERTNSNLSDFRIICLSLQLQIFLKSKGIHYDTTLTYFDNDSHKRCLLKSDFLVSLMEERLEFPNNPEEINGYKDSYIYFIRYLNNHLLFLIEIVSNAVEALKPDKILVCNSDLSDHGGSFLTARERYLPYIVGRVANNRNITLNHISMSLKKEKKHTNISIPSSGAKPAVPKGDRLLLVPSCAYGLDNVVKKIKKFEDGIRTVYVHEGELPLFRQIYYRLFKGVDDFVCLDSIAPSPAYDMIDEDLKNALKILREHAERFEHRGVLFFDLLEPKIVQGISLEIKALTVKGARLSHAIRTLKPNLSLSYSSKDLTYILGELCRNNSLEALCISHGTVVPPKNEVEEIVNRNIGTAVILNRYPSVAVQTPWCEKFLNHYEHLSKDIVTGPLLFRNDLSRKRRGSMKTLVHAVTLKTRFSTKFWGVETADEFVSSVRSLINSVERADNARLIVHLHPAYKYLFAKGELESLLPDSKAYSIVYSASIHDSLSKADFLVSFSSTTIEEATINEIPVILFDKWGRYQHFDSQNLAVEEFHPYPVYYIPSERILNAQLPYILAKGTSQFVKKTDWGKYHFGRDAENGFINYLHQCFRRGGDND